MRSLELFSGAGGLAKGLEMAGFEHQVLIEFNRDAAETLRRNFKPAKVFEGDVRDYDFSQINNIELVAGGPPCQPFSLGGKHKASDDQRDMFPYSIEAIDHLRPKAFIFENVKGLLRPSFSEYFEYILLRLKYPSCHTKKYSDWKTHLDKLRSLSNLKNTTTEYNVQYKLINTANYGVPQSRERVIIVGIRPDLAVDWRFPEGEHNLDRLLWEQYVSLDYWDRHCINTPLKYAHSSGLMRRIDGLYKKYGLFPPSGKPWATMRDVLGHLPDPGCDKHTIADHQFRGGARSYAGHTGSLFDLPSKTIKAGAHGVPGGENMIRFADDSIRYLTVHEAKLIQTFPEEFEITGTWGEAMRQIGNAVPVEIGRCLGVQLLNALSEDVEKQAA